MRPWCVAIVLGAACFAPRPAHADGERPILPEADAGDPVVTLCPRRDTLEARRAANDVAQALALFAPCRVAPPGACAFGGTRNQVLIEVDLEPDGVVLTPRGRDGRTWSPRTVSRAGDGTAVFRERVAVAARSLVGAALEAEGAAAAASSTAPETDTPRASAPSPSTSATAATTVPASPSPSLATPVTAGGLLQREHPSRPESAATDGPARSWRLESAYTAATVGAAFPVESGGAVSAFWARSALGLGLSYLFFPGATVALPDTSLSIARHTVSALVRLALRVKAWELGGAAGPLLDVWLRSTTATRGTPTAPASLADGGATLRADATYWLSALIGVQAAFAVEVAPWRPRFQGPSGPVLDPAFARARLALGVAAALP